MMPIIGWLCGSCGGRQVGLSHFAETSCGETYCHPDYAAALLADRASQGDRVGVHVSHGLSCPRRAAIEDTEDYYVDPLTMLAALTGTFWHKTMDWGGTVGAHYVPRTNEVEVSGVIAGIKLTGRIDRLRDDLIEDHKSINDFSVKHIKANGAKFEHAVQISLYAELAEQSGLCRPTRGIIWYKSNFEIIPLPVKLLSIEDALEVHPYSGIFTVRELLQQMAKSLYYNAMQRYDWRDLPLAGLTMSFGSKSMCQFCAVQSICTQANNGQAPF